MKRHWIIFKEFFRTCLVEELEYRSEFMGNLLSSLFGIGIAILTIQIFFYQTNQLGGWSYPEVLILLGIFNMLQGMIDFALRPNITRFAEHVRKGTLDYVLTKPVDSMFFVSFRHLVFWRLIDVFLGIGLIIYGLVQKQYMPTLMDSVMFFTSIFSSIVLIYSMWMLLMTTAFWVVKMEDLSFVFSSFFETTRFPISMYRSWLRTVLTYVLPAAFLTSIPAASLFGRWDIKMTLISACMAIIFLFFSRKFWKFALRSYTSASS